MPTADRQNTRSAAQGRVTALAPRRLNENFPVYGWSYHWFAVSLTGFWVQLPFLFFQADSQHVEFRVGSWKYGVTFEMRWRWE